MKELFLLIHPLDAMRIIVARRDQLAEIAHWEDCKIFILNVEHREDAPLERRMSL